MSQNRNSSGSDALDDKSVSHSPRDTEKNNILSFIERKPAKPHRRNQLERNLSLARWRISYISNFPIYLFNKQNFHRRVLVLCLRVVLFFFILVYSIYTLCWVSIESSQTSRSENKAFKFLNVRVHIPWNLKLKFVFFFAERHRQRKMLFRNKYLL